MGNSKEKILEILKKTYCRLQPSKISGVGVFAIKPIKRSINPFPRLRKEKWYLIHLSMLKGLDKEVMQMIDDFYVIEKDGKVWVSDAVLNGMDISYFVNNSNKPNLKRISSGEFITIRKIKKGEEMTVSYETYDYKWKKSVGRYPSRVVEDISHKGKELVATEDLPRGIIVEKFEGPVIKYAKVPKDMIRYAIFVGDKKEDDMWVVSKTNAIYANHSCNPNCRVDDSLNIVTLKPVKKGEELTYSYNSLCEGEKISDFVWDKRWNFVCKCGSKKCQKKIDRYV